ncbi:hypothetical protein Tcan_18811 [Toxocara canis]|uniref:Uncharacterized protein n=1 Tax=Toxocara canis TaxID=6265 RepID=A0A0B2W2N7_TOXCA|nr:hypothetical protein Tcan_18811 [Toxocara canis]
MIGKNARLLLMLFSHPSILTHRNRLMLAHWWYLLARPWKWMDWPRRKCPAYYNYSNHLRMEPFLQDLTSQYRWPYRFQGERRTASIPVDTYVMP